MTVENPADVERSLAHMVREATREDISETFGDAPAGKPSSLRLVVRTLMASLEGEPVNHLLAWVTDQELEEGSLTVLTTVVVGSARVVQVSCRLGEPALSVMQLRLKDMVAARYSDFRLEGVGTGFSGWEVPRSSTISLEFGHSSIVIPSTAFHHNRDALTSLMSTLNDLLSQ